MYPIKNPTKDTLETLQHDVMTVIGEAMNKILDNGDRPDKRVTAIIGLNQTMQSTLKQLDRIIDSIPTSH
jgi:hypothetical protein